MVATIELATLRKHELVKLIVTRQLAFTASRVAAVMIIASFFDFRIGRPTAASGFAKVAAVWVHRDVSHVQIILLRPIGPDLRTKGEEISYISSCCRKLAINIWALHGSGTTIPGTKAACLFAIGHVKASRNKAGHHMVITAVRIFIITSKIGGMSPIVA